MARLTTDLLNMPGQSLPVSIIIPVFNKWRLTRQCLESLRQHTPGDFFEVLVVDNGSTDDTGNFCQSLGSSLFGGNFRHVRLENNINFGPACNLGARESRGKLLFFLNNDTLLTPDWWPPLLNALENNPRIGAVGPLMLYPGPGPLKDRVQHLGIAVEPQLYLTHLYEVFPRSHPLVHKNRYFQALTAAALLLPKKTFLESGGFFEGYMNGGEDVDLGCQLRQHGLWLTSVAASCIYHLVSQTPGRHLHEKHNGETLKSRCARLLMPDLHLFAPQDGYELRLSPCLQPYLALPERRARVLARQCQKNGDPAQCQYLVEKEPLWLEGYERLAALWEEKQDFVGAVPYRFLLSHFFPSRRTFAQLWDTARRAGDSEKMALAQSKLDWIRQMMIPGELLEIAHSILGYVRQLQQPALVQLYQDWLEQTYPKLTALENHTAVLRVRPALPTQ